MKRGSAILAAIGVLAGAAVSRRHRQISGVAPELRKPMLYFPIPTLRNRCSLLLFRLMLTRMTIGSIAPGVQVYTEHISAAEATATVRVLIYEPGQRTRLPSGALLWIHGGGLVTGRPEQGNDICSRIAADLGIIVVSVDYRLAPEHPFPAGLEDCYAALEWIHHGSHALDIDASRVAVGGDSAGGGLAACLAQMAADRGGPPVRFQLLQYPMLDDRTALRRDHDAILWSNRSNRFGWEAYLGHRLPPSHAVAARRSDFAGLPPAWIGVGSIDLFYDECRKFAHQMRSAGVDCELYDVQGMYHGADRLAPGATSMATFMAEMITSLRSALA